MEHPKIKVTITLAPELLRAVDKAARRTRGASRSSVIEARLRRAARMELEDKLRADTIAYYESLSREEKSEDASLARASSRAARRLELDDG